MEVNMIEDVVVEPITEEFILWRCLHGGPLSFETIDLWPETGEMSTMPWERYRERNVPLLRKLIQTYGTCAIVARDGDQIVGQLRFYPKVVCAMNDGSLCLQQDHPAGPGDRFADNDFPDPAAIEDKTLSVHCMMTGSSLQAENPYQRKGIGTRMARTLIQWAGANGWEHIEADAFEEIPHIYEVTGSTGYMFWEKLGFYVADRHPHPHLNGHDDFVRNLEEQAKAIGISPEMARDRIIMRLDLI
jgi:GNAT superfamily N-acetyltransferase